MTRPIAARILALAAVVGVAAQGLLLDSLLGINVPILTAAVLGVAWLLRSPDRPIDRLDRWIPPSAMAFAIAVALRADPFLLLLDVVTACALLGASVAAIGGEAVTRRSAARIVELGFTVLGWAGIGILRVTAAVRRRLPGTEATSATRNLPPWAVPVARGLVIAIPILFVFAGLFAAADVAFDRLMSTLFTWDVDLGELPYRLAVAFLVAWAVAGLLAVAAGGLRDADDAATATPNPAGAPMPQSLGAAAAVDPLVRPLRLGAIEAATILIAVDVLFGVFVLIQLTYLFGGQSSLEITGVPYSEYARSGFFELVWVALLAGGLLTLIHAIAARRTVALVASGLALAGLTAAVLVSAVIRLRIYQEAYGWTELRFYVLATIVWLAIGIGITMVLLARDRMGWLVHGLTIAALVVLAGVNVVGPARLIADENVARVLNPALVPPDGKTGLDVGYAVELGADAVPALVRALPAVDPRERSYLLAMLRERAVELETAEATGWPSWNLGRERAREALRNLPDR
jgi:hypothetical protein